MGGRGGGGDWAHDIPRELMVLKRKSPSPPPFSLIGRGLGQIGGGGGDEEKEPLFGGWVGRRDKGGEMKQ